MPEINENEELAILNSVLAERPKTKDSFLVYRYRGTYKGVTALGGKTLRFYPDGFGDSLKSPIKKRPTKDCEAYCSRERSIVMLDEELGMSLLRQGMKKHKAGSREAISDAWEEMFGDVVPSISQYAEDERLRTSARKMLRNQHGVQIPDADFLEMDLQLLQKAVATKGQAYWQWKMDATASTDAPSSEVALSKAQAKHFSKENPDKALKEELRTLLKDVAAKQGLTLNVGAKKEIKPLWGTDRILKEIAKYDESEAKAVGWKG